MNIIIVTGRKGAGKSTYLKKLINDDFDGIITICVDRKLKKYEFFFVKKKESLLCCNYDNGMKFNIENFEKANDYLANQNKGLREFKYPQTLVQNSTQEGKILSSLSVVVDEVGWMELEEKGLYRGVKELLNNKKINTLYISMRYDIHKKLIDKFGIIDYKLVLLDYQLK